MSLQDVEIVLDGLAAVLLPVTLYFLWRPLLRDPDDAMMLDAAVSGGMEVIVLPISTNTVMKE